MDTTVNTSEPVVEATSVVTTDPPASEEVVAAATSAVISDIDDKTTAIVGVLRLIANGVAKSNGDVLGHRAIACTAAEHSPAEVSQLLGYVSITVAETSEAVAPYLVMVDNAKAIIREEFADYRKPDDGDAPAASKKAKKAKESKESKKAKEPKAEAAEKPEKKEIPILDVETVEVKAADHELPEEAKRADALPRPDVWHLEVGEKRTSKNVHQVDPSRVQSCTPVMPNLDLLAKSGNPYPAAPDETVKTADKYKPFSTVSHVTFLHLKEVGTMNGHPDKEAVKAILEKAGVKESAEARTCIQDTLRDLALYGLVKQQIQQRTRIFTLL